MSIAVTAVVRQSRTLRLAVLAMGIIGIAAGVLLMLSGADAEAPPLHWVRSAAGLLIIAGVTQAVRHHARRLPAVTIDISAAGAIRLLGVAQGGQQPGIPAESCRWYLLPGTTIWEYCLILQLKNADDQRHTLMVFPDTVPPTIFRALAVACRWIAAHNNRARSENA